jgi:hypothetical protein
VIEELEDVAARLAAAWDVKEKRHRQNGTFHEDHLSKRMRGGLQGDLGVQSQGEKCDSKTTLVDLEGGVHPTRVKKDMAEREKELGVVFRVCERERWPYIMGTECILQIEEYARVINEQSIARTGDRDVGFECCGLLDRIWSLGFSSDLPLLKKLLVGDYGGSSADALNLQKFAGRSVKIPVESTPCPCQNRALVVALQNMDLVLSVFYGPSFRGTTTAFVDQLEGLQRPMELAPSGFLLHSIEIVLTKYFRSLRMATTVANASERDISTPAGCAARLSTVLKEFSSTINTQERLSEAMAWYQLRESRAKLGNAAKMVPLVVKAEVKGKSDAAAGSPVVKPMCGEHFAGQLKVQDPKTSRTFVCSFGERCRFCHDDIAGWTEAKKASTAASLSLRFRQPSIDALGRVKNGKTRV